MAAITAALFLLKPGDHLVVSEDLYGGTYRLLSQIFVGYALAATYVDTTEPNVVELGPSLVGQAESTAACHVSRADPCAQLSSVAWPPDPAISSTGSRTVKVLP